MPDAYADTRFNPDVDSISAFAAVSKNLTDLADGVGGFVSMPVRGTLGVGTGIYEGVFMGIDYAASPKFDLMLEYLSKGIRQESTVNAGIRFKAFSGLNVNAGTLGFEDFYAGASYSLSTY